MDSKFTHSPWQISEIHVDGTWDVLAEIWGKGNGWNEIALRIESEDDARLIAAAPDLLALVKEFRDYVDENSEIWERCKALIAKAEGKA